VPGTPIGGIGPGPSTAPPDMPGAAIPGAVVPGVVMPGAAIPGAVIPGALIPGAGVPGIPAALPIPGGPIGGIPGEAGDEVPELLATGVSELPPPHPVTVIKAPQHNTKAQ